MSDGMQGEIMSDEMQGEIMSDGTRNAELSRRFLFELSKSRASLPTCYKL